MEGGFHEAAVMGHDILGLSAGLDSVANLLELDACNESIYSSGLGIEDVHPHDGSIIDYNIIDSSRSVLEGDLGVSHIPLDGLIPLVATHQHPTPSNFGNSRVKITTRNFVNLESKGTTSIDDSGNISSLLNDPIVSTSLSTTQLASLNKVRTPSRDLVRKKDASLDSEGPTSFNASSNFKSVLNDSIVSISQSTTQLTSLKNVRTPSRKSKKKVVTSEKSKTCHVGALIHTHASKATTSKTKKCPSKSETARSRTCGLKGKRSAEQKDPKHFRCSMCGAVYKSHELCVNHVLNRHKSGMSIKHERSGTLSKNTQNMHLQQGARMSYLKPRANSSNNEISQDSVKLKSKSAIDFETKRTESQKNPTVTCNTSTKKDFSRLKATVNRAIKNIDSPNDLATKSTFGKNLEANIDCESIPTYCQSTSVNVKSNSAVGSESKTKNNIREDSSRLEATVHRAEKNIESQNNVATNSKFGENLKTTKLKSKSAIGSKTKSPRGTKVYTSTLTKNSDTALIDSSAFMPEDVGRQEMEDEPNWGDISPVKEPKRSSTTPASKKRCVALKEKRDYGDRTKGTTKLKSSSKRGAGRRKEGARKRTKEDAGSRERIVRLLDPRQLTIVICPHCQKAFTTYIGYSLHTTQVHNVSANDSPGTLMQLLVQRSPRYCSKNTAAPNPDGPRESEHDGNYGIDQETCDALSMTVEEHISDQDQLAETATSNSSRTIGKNSSEGSLSARATQTFNLALDEPSFNHANEDNLTLDGSVSNVQTNELRTDAFEASCRTPREDEMKVNEGSNAATNLQVEPETCSVVVDLLPMNHKQSVQKRSKTSKMEQGGSILCSSCGMVFEDLSDLDDDHQLGSVPGELVCQWTAQEETTAGSLYLCTECGIRIPSLPDPNSHSCETAMSEDDLEKNNPGLGMNVSLDHMLGQCQRMLEDSADIV